MTSIRRSGWWVTSYDKYTAVRLMGNMTSIRRSGWWVTSYDKYTSVVAPRFSSFHYLQAGLFSVNHRRYEYPWSGWCLFVGCSNRLVYLRDGSAHTIVRAATLR